MKTLRKGHQKRMQHQARVALESSKLHKRMIRDKLSSSHWPRKKFGYDLIEIFGGSSMISVRATSLWGMKVLQPVDIRYGVDLRKRSCRRWLLRMLDRWNPRLAIVEWPCTPWSILQRNVNYKDRPQELQALQDRDRPFLALTRDIFKSQTRRGGHAMGENPATADSHQQPEIIELRERFYETTSCLCQFGMVGVKQGAPLMKRVRFIATHPIFIETLNKQCDFSHTHELVEGTNTSHSAVYPPALGDAICFAYWQVVAQEDYGFSSDWQPDMVELGRPRGVNYVKADESEEKWRPLLQHALDILSRKNQNNIFLDPGTDLHNKIAELVPWQIMNVQLAYLPKAKRVRPGLEECHRASIMHTNEDTVVVEQEHLKSAQAPRERFVQPVRVAIFVLGHAPGEPMEPSPAQPPPVQRAPDDGYQPDIVEEQLQDQRLVRQDYASEVWFIGPPLTAAQKQVAPHVVRMHRNLGHPRNEDFVRALAQHGKVQPEAVLLARRLRCATCERTKKPSPPRPTSFKMTGSFNSRICMDFVYLKDANAETHIFLHVLEPNGAFNVFYPVNSRDPLEVFNAFSTVWASWAGYPQHLWVDKDGAFEGEFLDRMQRLGVDVDNPAAEAHWQAGEVETYNRAFRYVANKIIDEQQLAGKADMMMLAAEVGQSMNDKVRTSGASANQWVFGKNPQIPVDLLSPDGKIEALQGVSQDEELRRRTWARAAADAKLSEFRINEALRNAVLRLPRPPRTLYEPGELVAFWRNAKVRKGKRLPAGWHRATVIGPHKGDERQNNYWVTSGGKCILVSKEQLRPAYGTELWRVQEEDLQGLLREQPQEYYDEVGEPPPDDDGAAEDPGEMVPLYEPEGALQDAPDDVPQALPPARSSSPVPLIAASASATSDVTQPTRQQSEHSPLGARADPGEAASSNRAPGTPLGPLYRSPPQATEPEAKRQRLDDETDLDDAIERSLLCSNRYTNVLATEYFAHADYNRSVCISRKDQKALVREIPYDQIPPDQKEDYAAALAAEWGTWTRYEAVRVLSEEASWYAERHFGKERILASRVCYRNKNAAYPWMELKAKARIVCRGDRDPDLLSLRRDAPTMTRLGLMIILQIAASHADWFIFNADITGAFLQGDQGMASRKEPLFLRPPREGLPGVYPGQLLLVVRGIFGLANSPRLFWRHLRDTLKRLGFVQSTLDRALFMYYLHQRLVLVLGAHVDDLLGTGCPKEADGILNKVREIFDFGAWADTRKDEVLEYGGKQVRKNPDGTVELSQEKFIQAITVQPVPKWRAATPNAPLLPKEKTELKSGGGCLHWLTGQTRPDLAAATSLGMSGQPTVQNLIEINKLLKEAQGSMEWRMRFVHVPLTKARLVVYTDASWANAEELRSQAGYLVFLAGPEVFTVGGDQASLLDWRSHRIKRKCRSTLAAETMSLDAGFDAGLFARELLAEILIQDYQPTQCGDLPVHVLPVHPVTDCRSLYDLVTKDGPLNATQEKRLTLDIGAIRESAEELDRESENLKSIFRWADTHSQLADHLTKVKPSWQLRETLTKNHIALKKIEPPPSDGNKPVLTD